MWRWTLARAFFRGSDMAGSVRVVVTGATGKVAQELLAGLSRSEGV